MNICTVFNSFLLFTVLLLGSLLPASAAEPADLIIYNAKVIPATTNVPTGQAIAVKDGKILAVGKESPVRSHKGANTRMIDAHGATVLPGLGDSSVESFKASVSELNSLQPPIRSIAEALDYIRQQAAAKKTNEWIILNWLYPTRLKENRFPTKAELDAAAPKNPVFWNCGPVAMVNAKAFELSKITKSTPNPPGGEIVIGDDRQLTGMLRDASILLKLPPAKPAALADHRAALVALYQSYNQQGITSISEQGASPEAIDLFRDMEKSGELTVRISCDRLLNTASTTEESITRLNSLTNAEAGKLAYGPSGAGDDWVRIGQLKVKMDGDVSTGTAYLRAPWGIGPTYQNRELAYKGRLYQDPEVLTGTFTEAAQQGWQISADCSGDAALDELLNSYQKVGFKMDIHQRRFVIGHARFQGKQNWERCIKYGLVTEAEPAVYYQDGDSLIKTLGDRRMTLFLPFKSYYDNKLVVGAGSGHYFGLDATNTISPYNPWLGVYAAVARITEQNALSHADEKVSREEAIEMYTKNNAWLTFEEKKKGTLEPGKFADLIMVNTDLMKCNEDELRQTKVLLTVVGGKVVWDINDPKTFAPVALRP